MRIDKIKKGLYNQYQEPICFSHYGSENSFFKKNKIENSISVVMEIVYSKMQIVQNEIHALSQQPLLCGWFNFRTKVDHITWNL